MRTKIASRKKVWFFVAILLVLAVIGTACTAEQGGDARKDAVQSRLTNFDRAEALFPAPQQQNFPARQVLVDYTRRQDLLNHPWYIYILGENGNAVHYFVSTSVPVNACNFLSSTEIVRSSDRGNLILTAPSLDGVYYGGSGASASCSGWIVKDAATNAMLIIYGDKMLVSDQPLLLDTQPIRIQINTIDPVDSTPDETP